jgi:hypothetical protein
MKKILLISLLIFLGISFTYAQSYEDVVYLHNGSVIRGLIIEQVPNESVKIQTRDGNIFVYKMSEIQKMTKELDDNSNYQQNRQRQNQRQSQGQRQKSKQPQVICSSLASGYFGFADLGFGIGSAKITHLGFEIVNGYRIIPQFAIGIGVGLNRYSKYQVYHSSGYMREGYFSDGYWDTIYDYSLGEYVDIFIPTEWVDSEWVDTSSTTDVSNSLSMPIFLHLRSDFLNGKISPFSAVNIGYNVGLVDSMHEGLIFEPSLGVGIEVSPKSRLDISLGYSLMGTKVETEYGDDIKSKVGYFKIKVGISW